MPSTKDLPWFELHVERAIAAKQDLSWDEFGRYVFLWLMQWKRGGRLPGSRAGLERLADLALGLNSKEFEFFWDNPDGPRIGSKYVTDSDGTFHPFLEEIAQRSVPRYENTVSKTTKGGAATKELWRQIRADAERAGISPMEWFRMSDEQRAKAMASGKATSPPAEGFKPSASQGTATATATATSDNQTPADAAKAKAYLLDMEELLHDVLGISRQLWKSEKALVLQWLAESVPFDLVADVVRSRGSTDAKGRKVRGLQFYADAVAETLSSTTEDLETDRERLLEVLRGLADDGHAVDSLVALAVKASTAAELAEVDRAAVGYFEDDTLAKS